LYKNFKEEKKINLAEIHDGFNSASIKTDGFVLLRKLGHPELVFN